MLIPSSAMIQLQPEIIMAKISTAILSSNLNSINDPDGGYAYVETKNKGEAQNRDNISWAYYRSVAMSRSWMRYLLGSWECHRRYHKTKERESVEVHAKYSSPAWSPWLLGRGLDVAYFQCKSDWQVTVRPYRRLPSSHKLFCLAATGDVAGLQSLLSSREVSVYGKDESRGQTALHVSVGFRVAKVETLTLPPSRSLRV